MTCVFVMNYKNTNQHNFHNKRDSFTFRFIKMSSSPNLKTTQDCIHSLLKSISMHHNELGQFVIYQNVHQQYFPLE
jgi:hypothetical protein